MNKLNNIIVCILGKSGCGKTTIVEKLQEEYGYEVLSSYTTRQPRYNGETGHQFVDLQTFNDLKDKVAYNKFNDHHYCATKLQVDESDLYVVDVPGLKQLKQLYIGKEIVSIYIDVPMEICLERMRRRGDTDDKCWERLRHDYSAFKGVKGEVDYVVNGVPSSTWYNIATIIEQHNKKNKKYTKRSGVYETHTNIC